MRKSTLRRTWPLTSLDTGACMQLEKSGLRFSGSCYRNWFRNMDTRMTCSLPPLSKMDLFHLVISTVAILKDLLFPSTEILWWCSKSIFFSLPYKIFRLCCIPGSFWMEWSSKFAALHSLTLVMLSSRPIRSSLAEKISVRCGKDSHLVDWARTQLLSVAHHGVEASGQTLVSHLFIVFFYGILTGFA